MNSMTISCFQNNLGHIHFTPKQLEQSYKIIEISNSKDLVK